MAATYFLTPTAFKDLTEISDYWEREGEHARRIILDSLMAAIQRLSLSPNLGHRREDLTRRPVLFSYVRPYFVVYDGRSRPIQVIRLLHAARDVRRELRRS